MWMILGPPFESRECLPPTDSPLTEFNESEIFAGADYFSTAGTLAWVEIIGRLLRAGRISSVGTATT